MSNDNNDAIRSCGIISEDDTGRPSDSGAMLIQTCEVHPALPCIVILVHGVNDVGEAYQNQDIGLCIGLNNRLNRTDLHPHSWIEKQFQIADIEGNITTKTCDVKHQTCIDGLNRSPVIPFYWGYKPVDKASWEADQKAYQQDLKSLHNEANIPYNAYREEDPKRIAQFNDQNIDNFGNWLDRTAAKGGGTFANATTNIPDMFGPGASGAALKLIGELSRSELNDGDWSHPIYDNPHRIYQAYAARRLANLILEIRNNDATKNDAINIVAHSQGTIITMLANMWVKEAGKPPADCVILNHSPYSLENRWLENTSPGNQQTDNARQKTLAHFCQLMGTNPLYNGGKPHDGAYQKELTKKMCLPPVSQWGNPLFSRNNFGLVYNYFCPNDGVVSMFPIQGFGWSGVRDAIRNSLGDNFRQRAFCKGFKIGDRTDLHFLFPRGDKNAPEVGKTNASYHFYDVTINAPLLPEPFEFSLMGQDNPERHQTNPDVPAERYRAVLDGNDPDLAGSAISAQEFLAMPIPQPKTPAFYSLHPGDALNQEQLDEISKIYNIRAMSGEKIDWQGQSQEMMAISGQDMLIKRQMTKGEIQERLKSSKNVITYSQHSSIVANKDVPSKAMAFDLAIGRCNAFEIKKGEFWRDLLLLADWRQERNPDSKVKDYYQNGKLPIDFKGFMNKPEREKGMPTGDSGVVNEFGGLKEKVVPRSRAEIEMGIVPKPIPKSDPVLQWDMPEPKI
jgi:hypothetical protein